MLLGQSDVLSGPLGVAMKSFNAGAHLAFEDVNARGGVAGRKLRVVSLDDGLKPDVAVANYRRRTGRNLTRELLHETMRTLKTRIGSMDVDFSGPGPTGSRFVDLVHVNSQGRFRR